MTALYTLPNAQKFSDGFYTFSIVWSPQAVEFFVDGNSYEKVTPASIPPGTKWVFNKPFFLLLNVAVGGSWPGSPDASTQFPQTMTVDYVRVYQAAAPPAISSNGVVNAASFGPDMAPGSLASIFGTELADLTTSALFDVPAGGFRQTSGGTTVSVNGVLCPLILRFTGADQFSGSLANTGGKASRCAGGPGRNPEQLPTCHVQIDSAFGIWSERRGPGGMRWNVAKGLHIVGQWIRAQEHRRN